jgi:hypothetical protein
LIQVFDEAQRVGGSGSGELEEVGRGGRIRGGNDVVAEVDDYNIMVSSGGYRRLVGRNQADEGSPDRKRDHNPSHHHANTHAYILLEGFL